MRDNKTKIYFKPGRKSMRILALLVIGVAMVLSLTACSASSSQKIARAKKYVDDGDYDSAISEYQEAAEKAQDPVEAYKGLAEAALLKGDYDLARDTYQKLYDLTGDAMYLTALNSVGYGNTGSNIINGGEVTQDGDTIYYLQQMDGQADFWKIEDGKANKLNEFSLFDAESSGAPAKCLNYWDGLLYFIYKSSVYKMEPGTGNTQSVESPQATNDLTDPAGGGDSLANLQIYDGRMYFTKENADAGVAPNILSCTLEGSDQKLVYSAPNTFNKFLIVNGTMYILQSSPTGDSFNILSLDPKADKPEAKPVYSGQNQFIMSAAVSGDELIYNILTVEPGSAVPPNFGNDIYSLNTATGELKTLSSPGNVSALNIGGDKLYYVSAGALYSSGLDGSSPSKITDAPISNSLERMGQTRNSVCTAGDSVYLTTSTVQNVLETYGKGAATVKIPFTDPKGAKNMEEVLGSSEAAEENQ